MSLTKIAFIDSHKTMRISVLNHLHEVAEQEEIEQTNQTIEQTNQTIEQTNQTLLDNTDKSDKTDVVADLINLKYESVDTLNCYLNCAILLSDDEVIDPEFETTNYEPVDYEPMISRVPGWMDVQNLRINIGFNLIELLYVLVPFNAIADLDMSLNDICAFFLKVCDNDPERAERAANRLIIGLLFFDLCTIEDREESDGSITHVIHLVRMKTAMDFLLSTLGAQESENGNESAMV